MAKVVSINRKKQPGEYTDARNGEFIPEGAFLCAGVFFSMLLPQLALFVYGGFVPLIAFVASALAGAILGVAWYFVPYEPPACVETEAYEPPREDASWKEAA